MDPGPGLIAALTLGLATSLHCLGMCGAMVMAVAGAYTPGEGRLNLRANWGPQVLYHLGRAITYVALGAAVGTAGTALRRIGSMMGLHYLTMIVTIAILIAVALHLLGLIPVKPNDQNPGLISRLLAPILQGASRAPGALTLGVLTGFLPCGPLYAALALAASTAGPAAGALFMLAFWAGTAPLLFALGRSSSLLVGRLRRTVGVALAVAVITVAVGVMAVKISSAVDPGRGPSPSCPHCSSHPSSGGH